MNKVKIGGGCLLLVAGAFYLLAAFMFLDPLEGEGRVESLVPGLFFGSVVLAPGLAAFLWGHRRERQAAFEETLLGYVRSHDRFTSEELARKVGRTEAQVEELIAQLTNRPDVDLVFHRPDRSWMHRGRIREAHAVVSKCPSCGAGVGSQLIFAGEDIACPYCSSPLRSTRDLPQGPKRGIPPARPEDLPDHLK